MFGHLSPPSLMHELGTLAAFVGSQPLPLDGLKIFVTHVKDSLYPHRSGKTVKQRVQEELEQLERQRRLGVIFEVVEQGQRLCEFQFAACTPLADIL
jgi:cAMP phosphodiesterase